MDLVLWRHGPAQDPYTCKSDVERELTTEGRAVVAASVNSLVYVLRRMPQPLIVWTSPLVRARQTADLLAVALPMPVTEKPAIAEGQLELLLREWQGLSAEGTLVLVGHEPHLSQWGARIAGTLLPIQPAAAAAFTLESTSPLRGHLLWFAQAQALAQWGAAG